MTCRHGFSLYVKESDVEWGEELEPVRSKQAPTSVETANRPTSAEAEYIKQSHAPKTNFQPMKAGRKEK